MAPSLAGLEALFEIEGTPYYALNDVAVCLGVSRQSLWRWRRAGVIPAGSRRRDRRVLFSGDEVETIREYANRLEPIKQGEASQLRLFNGRNGGPA
jgi:hypothetical protein